MDDRPWRTGELFPRARLFARGRFALLEGLRALAAVRGVRRLWVPAYLCRPVVDAAAAAGLATALYDVDERLEPRWATIAPAAGDALLALHYFGLALPKEAVQAFAAAHRLPLVEDCAHAVPDPDAAVQVGSYGALAFFSLRKQVPMPGGGLLVVGDDDVDAAVRAPVRAGVGDLRTLAKLGLMLVERAATALDWNVLPVKDRLPVLDAHPAAGRRPRAPMADAAHSPQPAGTPAPLALLRPMLARLDWRPHILARQATYRALAARLNGVPGLVVPIATPPSGSVPQALPVWVDDPDAVVRALRARGVEAMRWPGREQIPFRASACPGTVAWLARTVLLPLGWSPDPGRLDAVLSAVAAAADGARKSARASVADAGSLERRCALSDCGR
jgi:dTDP-4-amino-4,6-dideoxygalactose transaminase